MKSRDYRNTIQVIIRNSMRKRFPQIKKSMLDEAAKEISASIHARFYGANVDGVGSPLWSREDEGLPNIDAQVLIDPDFDSMEA